MVALAACLLVFAPGSVAFAVAADAPATASPRTAAASSMANGTPVDSDDVDSVEPSAVDDIDSFASPDPAPGDDRPPGPNGRAPDGDSPGDIRPEGERPGERSPEAAPTATVILPLRTTSTSTTFPAAPDDDEISSDESAPKTTGSVSPVEAAEDPGDSTSVPTVDRSIVNPAVAPPTPSTTVATGTDGPAPGESAVGWNLDVQEAVLADLGFLAGSETSAPLAVEPVDVLDPTAKASAVVLSWLVERESVGPSMAMLSPLVVLLTIWEAAASAGSGLAAPASALGTFVVVVLFEKGHLANGARLLRRRSEV